MALYTPSGNPVNASRGIAALIRAEFALIQTAFNAVAAEAMTLTNKTINLTNNTLTGTKAQFNAACSDADFATLLGAEELRNKLIHLDYNSIQGTAEQLNNGMVGDKFLTDNQLQLIENKGLNLCQFISCEFFSGLTGDALTVNGTLTFNPSSVPASATDTGEAGQLSWDADYLYVCTATNTWKRAALSTW